MMERSRSQSAKPARRKLQKCDPKLKTLKAKRGSADSSFTQSPDSTMPSPSPRQIHNGAPDLSDAKWDHYLRPKTIITPASLDFPSPEFEPPLEPRPLRTLSERRPSHRHIPEFSHLAINDAITRPSLDSSSLPSPTSSTSTSSTMRRQAKTPVFRIGQLEAPELIRRSFDSSEKTSSVELIADQYRALLESRDAAEAEALYHQSLHHTDPWSPNSLNLSRNQSLRDRPGTSSSASRRSIEIPPRSRPSTHSSAHQNGEPAGFAPEAIYFKPILFTPAPSLGPECPPSPNLRPAAPSRQPSPPPDNLGLQICLDLLTRELSSAIAGHPHRTSRETAALQIWAMIEAYERLRDQVTRVETGNSELQNVGNIFDSWLSALYSIHSSLTNGSNLDPSCYAGLGLGVE